MQLLCAVSLEGTVTPQLRLHPPLISLLTQHYKRCTNNQAVLPDLQLLLVLLLVALVVRDGLPRKLEQLQLPPGLDGRSQLGRVLGCTGLELQGREMYDLLEGLHVSNF